MPAKIKNTIYTPQYIMHCALSLDTLTWKDITGFPKAILILYSLGCLVVYGAGHSAGNGSKRCQSNLSLNPRYKLHPLHSKVNFETFIFDFMLTLYRLNIYINIYINLLIFLFVSLYLAY